MVFIKLIPIGTITKPHGVRGALRLKADTDFKEERFARGNTLYIRTKAGDQAVTVKTHQQTNALDIVTFEEFDSINDVERLRQCTVFFDAQKRRTLEDDTFYYDDLTGLDAYQNDIHIGTVKSVQTMPQSAMLRIERPQARDALVPFLKEFIKAVDLENNTITIAEIEGLL